jgi:hypothetical protein
LTGDYGSLRQGFITWQKELNEIEGIPAQPNDLYYAQLKICVEHLPIQWLWPQGTFWC